MYTTVARTMEPEGVALQDVLPLRVCLGQEAADEGLFRILNILVHMIGQVGWEEMEARIFLRVDRWNLSIWDRINGVSLGLQVSKHIQRERERANVIERESTRESKREAQLLLLLLMPLQLLLPLLQTARIWGVD
jgi:hypothetical protein